MIETMVTIVIRENLKDVEMSHSYYQEILTKDLKKSEIW